MLSREERIFSELLLARGLVAQEFIEGFAKKASGDGSEPSLAEVLIDSGGLERSQAEEVLEEARAIDATLAPHIEGGTRLGEFLLIREIGRGGMGIVYEAEQESLGRRVALKVLSAGAALDERLAIRFLREARAAGKLQHPGIVPVFASGRAEGVLFFAMELVDGRSLAEVAASGPMEPEQAARITAEVARALEHAHRAGLVHRDVKPENILLAADGRARLTDFGLVHETLTTTFTLPRHVLGTPAYMAPEQALGNAVDQRSDIYALGAVLYTLLSGKAPYAGELPSVVLSRVLAGPPAPLRSVKADPPPSLVAICERAMARKPEDRYATAAAYAEDLEAFGRGERPAAAAAPARSRRISRIAGLAAILIVAAVIATVTLRGGARAPVKAPPGGTTERAPADAKAIFDPSTLPPSTSYQVASYQTEVGVKFRSDTCGYVTGIRFFKDHRNDGAHVGHLWTGAGALLATAIVSGETPEGWQEASLTSPVRIAPNTTYVASYLTGAGKGYNQEDGAFRAAGIDRPPLRALRSGVDGCNGVFKFGPPRDLGGFPDQCGDDSNYFVDVLFREIDCASNADPSFGLVDASRGGKTWPALSPDGKLLGYASCAGGRCETFLQDLSTGDIVKLAAGRSSLAFAPDGRRIAFGTDTGVDVLNFDGRTIDERSIRHLATPFPAGRPAWSPNGAEVVFSALDDSKAAPSSRGIWIGEPAAGRVRLLKRTDAAALAYSPRGTRIAFVSRTGGAADLWTIRPDGGDATRLTSDAAAEWSPFWSPDGRRIYFGSDRGGTPRIWSLDVDETSGRPVGDAKAAFDVAFPAMFYATLSADGARLAIVCETHDGRMARLSIDPLTGALSALPEALPDYAGGAMTAQLSPDGTQLVYVEPRNQKLRIVAADGSGEPLLLTTDNFAESAPRWSPDGQRLAFQSNRSGSQELWIVRPDGSDRRQITKTTNGGAGYPVWTPEGTRLAYSVDRQGGFVVALPSGDGDSEVEAMPPYGSEQYFEPWSWSPDGTTLAGSADGVGVILYSVRERTYRRITDFGGHPVWLSDGRRMLFVGGRKIFMIDSGGGGLREIYAAAPASIRPFLSVSADGRAIYTSLGAIDESVWIANLPL